MLPNLIYSIPCFRWHRAHHRRGFIGVALFVSLLAQILAARAEDGPLEKQRKQMESIDSYASATNDLGSWIWDKETHDDQTCRLWRSFDIPAGTSIVKSRLVMTVDNEFTFYLDGRKLGHGAEWRELFVFDPTPLLTPGRHILAIDCYNGSFSAGLLFGLRIELADGRSILVKSDANWRIVPLGIPRWEKLAEAEPSWPAATIMAPLGSSPWWTQPMAVNLMPSVEPVKIYFWQAGWFQISLAAVCLLVMLVSLWLITQLAINRRERFLLQDERTRIARDIHDDMGGRMTQLVVHVEVTQSELPDHSAVRPQLTWICDEMRGLLSTMDEVLWVVNPGCDTLGDFADYVCNYAQEFLKPAQIQCFFAIDPKMPPSAFDFPLRRSLLMAIKEALNNALKHSGASELHLEIRWQDPRLVVVVQDNGRGFDMKAVKPGRNGLTNMTQRLRELDGDCQIASQPGEGCRVEFRIRLHRSLSSAWQRMWKERLHFGTDRKSPGEHEQATLS